jgi:hypothetical protein
MTGKTIGEHWLEVCADLEGQIISHKVRIEALTAEKKRLRKALMAAPIIGAREGQVAFKSRQDKWLKTKYREALEKQP